MLKNRLWFISIVIWLALTIAAQCQQPTAPPATALPQPSPTPLLIPRITPGDGTDLVDHLLDTGIIRVGIRVWPEPEFSPPAFRGITNAALGGALTGFEVDLAHHIAAGLGLELELVEAYPPVIASGNWRGEWDIALASLVPFDQPAGQPPAQPLTYSRPYAYMPTGLLAPTANDTIQTLAQLDGRRVGVLEHSAYQRLLAPTDSPLTVDGRLLLPQPPANVQRIALSNLQKGIYNLGQTTANRLESEDPPVDLIFGPAPIFLQAITKHNLPVRLIVNAETMPTHPWAVATVPRDGLSVERLIAEIDAILARLNRTGTLPELHLRWYEQDYSQPPG